MKNLLAVVLVLSFGVSAAQTSRTGRNQSGNRRRASQAKNLARTAPAIPLPIFIRRRGIATINEMMRQPPAFSYGSSINVWILKDNSQAIREIAVTGHGDSATCRRVSGQVMNLFLDKEKEPEDLFVAGAAHLVDHGDLGNREALLKQDRVQEFVAAQRDEWAAELIVRLLEKSAADGDADESALGKATEAWLKTQSRLKDLRADPEVQKYLRESASAEAINTFVSEVRRFSSENGLVNVREIPFEPIAQARARIMSAATSSQSPVISFEDLLQVSGTPEAALFTPMLTVPGGRPVELRIPFASLETANFDEAQRNNRDEVEQAIVGNANDRLEVFNQKRQRDRLTQKACGKLSAEELRKVITLDEICTPEGICYKTYPPEKITMEEYCRVRVPLNLKVVEEWIERTKKLLESIADDAGRKGGSRILEFHYDTLVDSMLRDWRLPVPRSQIAFDRWRATAREPVWRLLNAQLSRMGIAADVMGGEQLVFSIHVEGAEIVVRPIHVIDMTRSVLIADPASGATRVLDAWSMRSETIAVTADDHATPEVEGLVSESFRLLGSGDTNGAEARISAAFSRDPAVAFRSVEREWLRQFPDTHEQLLKTQESLKPFIEAIEWKEGLEKLKFDPSSKEEVRDELNAFHTFLESYPNAPVDLHLTFAIKLAGYLAEIQNELNKRRSAPAGPTSQLTAWDVLETYVPRTAGRELAVDNPVQTSAETGESIGPRIPTRVNRQKLETFLRSLGYKGKQLKKAADVWSSIQTSAGGSLRNSSYLEARSRLSLLLLADPAPMIREEIQTVIEREPTYWAAAIQARGLPPVRSREWEKADRDTREITLFESDAQLLSRLGDELRKSYSGLAAADLLSSEGSPKLDRLLTFINAAVGNGRTGSSPAFRAPQQTVSLFIKQSKAMDMLTRLQNASYLRSGSEELLAIARSRVSIRESPEGFRDSIPLRANLWFESGNYLKALDTLLAPEVPIALYSPSISWRTLPDDAATKPVSITARQEGSRIIFQALFDGGKKGDVLVLDGLARADADALLKGFSEISEGSWSEYGMISDQILLTPIALRPELGKFRDLLLGPKLRMLLVKSMVYGRNAPGTDLVQPPDGAPTLQRSIAPIDQVNGDQGRNYQVPSLDKVKQLANSGLRQGNR